MRTSKPQIPAPRFPTLLLAAAFACFSVAAMHRTAAAADSEKTFDIGQQSLATALNEFARQSDRQVLFSSDVANARQTDGVKGELEPEAALRQLLKGTGLTYRVNTDNTILVGHARSGATADVPSERPVLRVAQSETPGQSNSSQKPDAAAEDSDTKLEEIVVTAQKRIERLQSVPIALSVITGRELDSFTGGGVSDALAYLPSIVLPQSDNTYYSPGGSFISLRGVAASASIWAGASPTAVYIDGVPFGFVKSALFPNMAPYDLERVEALRGPHGTLYGASALNGVVRVLTHEPDLNEFGLKTRASVSAPQSGGETYNADVAVNIPLIPGKLAARAVLGYSEGGGWIDSPNGKNINDGQNKNVRLKLRAQPTDRLTLGLTGWLSRDNLGAPPAADARDFYPGTGNPNSTVDFDSMGFQVSYDFPAFSVTSMSSYINYESFTDSDLSWIGYPEPYYTRMDNEVFSQELTLTSTQQAPWRWTGGLFYRDAEDRLRQNQPVLIPIPIDFVDTSESYAVFGELTRVFLGGEIELTAGLRYFEDHGQSIENINFDGSPGPLINSPRKIYDALSPRAVLAWHPTDRTMLYASYAEGFRSGGDQWPTITSYLPDYPEYHPDTLKNYELGAKGQLFGGSLVYDLAYYFIDWQDIQQGIYIPDPVVPEVKTYAGIVNGDSASGTGFEIAVTFNPIKRLNLGLNYTRSDLATDSAVITPAGTVLIPKNSQLAYSPKYTVGGLANYAIALGGTGLEAKLSASMNYSPGSSAVSLVEGQSAQITKGDPTVVSGATLALRSADRWSVSFFVDNLKNQRNVGIPAFGIKDFPLSPSREPRTMGLQFEFRY